MKAIVTRSYGSPDVLELADVDPPDIGDDELLVRVHAAAANPLDWHFTTGTPYVLRAAAGLRRPKQAVRGVDMAGVVERVGSSVSAFAIGDRVFGGARGAFAELVAVAADDVVKVPDGSGFEEAAAMPVAAITALQGLRDHGRLRSGQSVLINGAAGGVGTYAVQIAKAMGATVTGVCSTRNVELVRSLGADRVFDYKQESYIDSGEQYDLVVDMVGNHSLLANKRVLSEDGTLVVVGGQGGDWLGPIMRFIGTMVLSPLADQTMVALLARMDAGDLAELAALMEAGELTSIIDVSYPLSQLPDAIRYSEEGRARGKIIINVD